MFPLIPKWNLRPNRPSFYDTDSATLLELASTLHTTMNSLIEDYNKFVDSTNKATTEFMQSETQKREVFEIAIRQEFQDFINVVDLKIRGMEQTISQINNNIEQLTIDTVNKGIADGRIGIAVDYNAENESISIIVNGGI